ncbi:hypothetical protein BDBG_18115, partial [Blastomyces gilchristii SLH14081]
SSYIDRFMSVNDCELNVELLIKNLKNVIIKKLSVIYITESSVSISFSSTASSKSSTLAPVFCSPAPATPGSATLTSATCVSAISATASAFIINSPCFKKMVYRLDKSHLS